MDNVLKHLDEIFSEQLNNWPEVKQRFDELDKVQCRVIASSGLKLQYNPSRIVSTAANISKDVISNRRCFLCSENRPNKQIATDLGDDYILLINPFPILKNHFTVVHKIHQRQSIYSCYKKFLEIASALQPGYIVFYNGPRSGASAPDHLHMQVGYGIGIPLIDKILNNTPPEGKDLITIEPFGFPIKILFGNSPEKFRELLDDMTIFDDEYEPRLNIISLNKDGEIITAFIPRGKHRPDCFYLETEKKIMVSPGAIDMCGLIITPRQKDFSEITEKQILSIYKEVTPNQPSLKVGIISASTIRFCLQTDYHDGNFVFSGEQSIIIKNGHILWNGKEVNSVKLESTQRHGTFIIHNVTIGIGFHWQRQEDQTFVGSLLFVPDGEKIWAINELPVEDYLTSVISSEMKSTAPKEFLKAHAVISRSWVMAQLKKRVPTSDSNGQISDNEKIIKWYDHDQHTLFDVCADDHCQRYQGITKIISPNAAIAVRETFGQTLVFDGHLCDARFSKCCGGITEEFQTCWQDANMPYLSSVADNNISSMEIPDLRTEEEAQKWILSTPKAFCSSVSSSILKRVLNGYDLETADFYRWQIHYSTSQITELFTNKSGRDIGEIIDLKPIKRGPSGRIFELLVVGQKGQLLIGKELEIRRLLSETHLFSSAFVPKHETDGFTLYGAGWGHGVGLCQIGAAVMGENGYDYQEILSHYYPGTRLGRFY